MKKYLIVPAIALFFTACKESSHKTQQTTPTDTARTAFSLSPEDTVNLDAPDSAMEEAQTDTFYVVMADTGNSYYQLHDDMTRLSKTTGLPIDTMGRGYNAEENLICLPENDEDEAYRGNYYPRRFPSVNLSLEYLDTYKEQSGEKTIVLVAGIFEAKQSADSLLQVIRPHSKQPFVEKAEIYTGCMH